MTYSLSFFNQLVSDAIEALPNGVRASFLRIAQRMETEGPDLGMPYTKAMGQGLFEIRARGPEGIGRVFYCTLQGRRIVLLHVLVKKTQATPDKDLTLARKRLSEVKRNE
jgi:phage-related protein